MNLDEVSDEDLIMKYINTNDDKYLSHLYQRHIPLMYGLCLKYLKNQQDAKDAVVFLYEDLAEKVKSMRLPISKTGFIVLPSFIVFRY